MKDIVILAGGKGTRLRGYSGSLPKPLVKVSGYHFLDYILFTISKYCFKNIYIIAGYRGDQIKNKYHGKIFNHCKIHVLIEKKLNGTGGALYEIKKKINDDFFLMNGDTVFDVNFLNLAEHSKKKNCLGVLALTKNINYKNNKKLNNLNLENKNLIKLSSSNLKQNYMNGGIYYFKKRFLNYISKKKISLEEHLIPKLIEEKKILGEVFSNFFIDIGTPKNLKFANNFVLKKFKKPAIFLNIDDVLKYKKNYVIKTKDIKLKNKTINYLKKKKNFYLFIFANQYELEGKKLSLNDFCKFQNFLRIKLKEKNIFIDDTKFCSQNKQNKKMFNDIIKKWPIIQKKSFMIDKKNTYKSIAKKLNLKYLNINNL